MLAAVEAAMAIVAAEAERPETEIIENHRAASATVDTVDMEDTAMVTEEEVMVEATDRVGTVVRSTVLVPPKATEEVEEEEEVVASPLAVGGKVFPNFMTSKGGNPFFCFCIYLTPFDSVLSLTFFKYRCHSPLCSLSILLALFKNSAVGICQYSQFFFVLLFSIVLSNGVFYYKQPRIAAVQRLYPSRKGWISALLRFR